MLASASDDCTVRLWEASSGHLLQALEGHTGTVFGVSWSPDGRTLASASFDRTVRLWEASSGRLLRALEGHTGTVYGVSWSPDGRALASASDDRTVRLWEASSGRLVRALEGHTGPVYGASWSPDGRALASTSHDGTVRLWRCDSWETVATLPRVRGVWWSMALAFHPESPLIATVGETDREIRTWNYDPEALLRGVRASSAVHHISAKIVLVGDVGVGKTGLGWRLAHGEFKDHSSTHGQQFWVLDALKHRRGDGAECEAVLWDLAGQPDYRLIHTLFLDDAKLALVLFNPANRQEPLHGIDYWLKALAHGRERPCCTILVGARIDVGDLTLTRDEIDAFCRDRGIGGRYIATSAKCGDGLGELVERMKGQIGWDDMPPTVTTDTFKRIKDFVLCLKEAPARTEVLTDPESLRRRLQETDPNWTFSDEEMMTAVGHLANYGYVRVIRTSTGERFILLAPDLLNNLAASFVLEARRNPKGLGALDEGRILKGEYTFRELNGLGERDRHILLDAATTLFLEHNLCFRETHGPATYLIFPELINLKKPRIDEPFVPEDDVSYKVSGDMENAYATLVVLLGYTNVFTRTNQWHDQAQYAMGAGAVCGFRQLRTGLEGEVEFVLYYAKGVGKPTRPAFQGLFELFLTRRRVQVTRYSPVVCPNQKCGYRQSREEVIRRVCEKSPAMFCSKCGRKVGLAGVSEAVTPGQVARKINQKQANEEQAAYLRTKYESALVTVKSFAQKKRKKRPTCFISYALGERTHEQWVEKRLAGDLQNAGVEVILDRWHNTPGSSILKFIERINSSDFVIAVGTRKYLEKYQTEDADPVVDAELRLIGTLLRKRTTVAKRVIPLLRDGTQTTSFPPLFEDSVYIDFRRKEFYFRDLFDLILTLYRISFKDPAVAELREVLNPETFCP